LSLVLGVGCGTSAGGEPRQSVAGGPSACTSCAGDDTVAGAAGAAGTPEPSSGGAPDTNSGGAADPPSGGAPERQNGGAAGEVASDVSLRAITILQTLEVPLMQAGKAVAAAARPAPLIAGKRAIARAFVDVNETFTPRTLIGVLDITTAKASRSLVDRRRIARASTQDDLGSSFDFDVSADDLSESASYRLRVLETDTTPLARFPEHGYVQLGARRLKPFELVLVPFIIGGFAPKTTEVEVQALRRRLLALYPSSEIEVAVAPPKTIGYVVDAEDGWDGALDELYQLRSEQAPPANVFYYGVMAPASSFDAFCPDGCIVGYSMMADADDVDSRGSIGIGVFPDGSGSDDAWDTVAHELGHALGRDHAPCGIDDPHDVDRGWPSDAAHRNAGLGVYGYDFDSQRLIQPRQAKDVMSYCQPVWIADYTYRGIFERLDYIQTEGLRALDAVGLSPPALFRLARIGRRGQTVWLGDRRKNGAAARRSVDLLDASGRRIGRIEAQVARADHGGGGYVWLPLGALHESGAASVDLRPFGGSVLPL
jgi:hypothetical protein